MSCCQVISELLLSNCKPSYYYHYLQVVQLILAQGADITLQNYNRESALEVASPLIKQIILDCVDHGEAPYSQRLLHAAWVGNHTIVNDILVCSTLLIVTFVIRF